MSRYSVYGHTITSEIRLDRLTPIEDHEEGNADISVGISRVSEHDQASGDLIVGSIPGVGRARIERGETITLEPQPTATDGDIEQAVIGACLGAALGQRGLLVLHGASVARGTQALTLLGPSGSGKSTLAAAFVGQGFGLLSDDISVIDVTDAPVVQPGAPQIRQFPDAVSVTKRASPVSTESMAPPTPLSCIYRLSVGTWPDIGSLSSSEAFGVVASNTRGQDVLGADQSAAIRHLRQSGELLRRVPVRSFRRPAGLEALNAHVAMLAEDAGLT